LPGAFTGNNFQAVRRKRKPTAHQKQIRFLAVFAAALMVLFVVALLWLLNRPHLASGN
jgi:Flp pilus assembly protein TadB